MPVTYTAFNFANATVLSYQHSNNFLGDGTARMSSSKEISIEVLLKNINVLSGVDSNTVSAQGEKEHLPIKTSDGAGKGVSESWHKFIEELAGGVKNFAQNITINGHEFGKGTINSIELTEDNPVRVGHYRVNLSIPTEGNISYLDSESHGYYTNFSSSLLENDSLAHYIKDIQENFSVDIDEEDKLQQTHSVTIQFVGEIGQLTSISASNKAVEQARAVANNLFSTTNTPSLGFIHQDTQTEANSTFQKHKSKKHYFSESYDLLNKSCTFSKVYDSEQNEDDYSLKIVTTLNLNQDGTASVTERGEIKGESVEQAQDAVETEISASSGRCQAAYDRYRTSFFGDRYGGGSYDGEAPASSLKAQPVEVGKEYTKKSKKASYSITYSNDPNLLTDHKHVYTVELNEDLDGRVIVTVSGELRPYKPVGINSAHPSDTNGLTSQLATLIGTANAKAEQIYIDESSASEKSASHLTLIKSDFTFPNNTLTGTYTREFSDDVSFRYRDPGSGEGPGAPGAPFKKMNVSVSDSLPTFMRNTYVVPNKEPDNSEDKSGYTLLHEPIDGMGAQTNMGQRTINIETIVPRPTTNVFSTIPSISTQLDACKRIAAQRAADVIGDFKLDPDKTLVYAESCEYNLDNNMNLSLSLTCNYTTPRDASSVANMGIRSGG